jgi:branched-chain amino acid transport system substrate-binding protein
MMIGKNRRKRTWFAAAVLAAGSLFATSVPANANSTGVSSSEIKLGITLPLDGGASFGYKKIGDAMNAYFAYVNDNGGVFGRKIKLIIKNDEYSQSLAISQTKQLLDGDKVFALVGALGTANHEAVAKRFNLQKNKIPDLFINTGYSGFANRAKFGTTFPILPSYAMEGKILAKHLKEKYPTKKVALIYQDDDFGKDVRFGFANSDYKFAQEIAYSTATIATDAAKIVSDLKTLGADVVVTFGVTQATGAILGAAARVAFAPQWVLGSVGSDATTLRALGVPAQVIAGAEGASFLPSPTDTSDEYVKLFQEVNTKYNKNVAFDNNVLVAMNTAMLTVQALRAAGKNLTRARLISAIQSKGSTFASAGLVPLNYSRTSNIGYNGYWIGKYDSSLVLKPVSGTLEVLTTDSAKGPVVKSNFKRPAMPEKGLPTNS